LFDLISTPRPLNITPFDHSWRWGEATSLLEATSFLDYGCGSGAATQVVKRALPTARGVGLDVDAAAVVHASKFASKADAYQGASTDFTTDASAVPDGAFDLVLCQNVFAVTSAKGLTPKVGILLRKVAPGGLLWIDFNEGTSEAAVREFSQSLKENGTASVVADGSELSWERLRPGALVTFGADSTLPSPAAASASSCLVEGRLHLSFKEGDPPVEVERVDAGCFTTTKYPTLWAPATAVAWGPLPPLPLALLIQRSGGPSTQSGAEAGAGGAEDRKHGATSKRGGGGAQGVEGMVEALATALSELDQSSGRKHAVISTTMLHMHVAITV